MFKKIKEDLQEIEDVDVLLSAIVSFLCFLIIAIAIIVCLIYQLVI